MKSKWIQLTKGKRVLVDADIYDELVAIGSWLYVEIRHKSGATTGYAARRYRDRVPTILYLHRVVMRAVEGQEVDHVTHDTLDCRRENLRFATVQQNNANRRKHGGSVRNFSSQYKGVCRPKDYRKWTALITINDRTIRLGTFETEEEAARAYDKAAVEAFGAFAYLNFPAVRRA